MSLAQQEGITLMVLLIFLVAFLAQMLVNTPLEVVYFVSSLLLEARHFYLIALGTPLVLLDPSAVSVKIFAPPVTSTSTAM